MNYFNIFAYTKSGSNVSYETLLPDLKSAQNI